MDIATLLFTLLVIVIYPVIASAATELPAPCSSEIFCHGQLLHIIQMASLFPDSKTFVDMKMKQPASVTLKIFNKLMNETDNNPSRNDLIQFLNNTFDPAGSEFEDWIPPDWQPSPVFLQKINDRALRKWATHLHQLWKLLGRKMKQDVINNSHLYSIIPVSYPVIVPGGRFREFYYWDSYWIIRGLLLSEMKLTVKGMLSNFISIVERYGLIPNGGRIYYLMRSQPPLLIPMVDSYLEFTNDFSFIKENINSLEKEFLFWMHNRTTKINKDGKQYTLCRYQDSSAGARPESYREDYNSAKYMKDTDKDRFYSEMKTAAESGWDFSTRWFVSKSRTDNGNLTDIKIKSIIPVDLNAIIYWNARILSKFFNKLNDQKKSELYKKIGDEWLEAVTKILWNPEVGVWLDYDTVNQMNRDYFYPSNLSPLWSKCYPVNERDKYIDKVIKYINKNQLMNSLGGIPSSLVHSGEQWDYPNAWPPLQHMIITGLDNTGNMIAQQMAAILAERWIHSNYMAYKETGNMYEKYDATVIGGHGGGGEYEVQLGFGWTNGVIMDLLHKYGDIVDIEGLFNKNKTFSSIPRNTGIPSFTNQIGPFFTLVLAFGASLAAGCIGVIVYATRQSLPRLPDKSKYIRIPGTPKL